MGSGDQRSNEGTLRGHRDFDALGDASGDRPRSLQTRSDATGMTEAREQYTARRDGRNPIRGYSMGVLCVGRQNPRRAGCPSAPAVLVLDSARV